MIKIEDIANTNMDNNWNSPSNSSTELLTDLVFEEKNYIILKWMENGEYNEGERWKMESGIVAVIYKQQSSNLYIFNQQRFNSRGKLS